MLDKAAAAATATTAAAATATAAAGAAGAFALRASRGSVDDSRFSRRLSSSPNSPGRPIPMRFGLGSSSASGLFSSTRTGFGSTITGFCSSSPSSARRRSGKVLPHQSNESDEAAESGDDHHASAQSKGSSSAVTSVALEQRTEGGARAGGVFTSSCVSGAIADDTSSQPGPSQPAEGSSPAMDPAVPPLPSGSHSGLQELSRSKWVETPSATSERSLREESEARRRRRSTSTWVNVEGPSAASEQPSQVLSSEPATPSQGKKHRVAPALDAVLFEERLHSWRASRAEHPLDETSDSAQRPSSSPTRCSCSEVDGSAEVPARRVSRVAPDLPVGSSPEARRPSARNSLSSAVQKHPQVLFAKSVSGKHMQLQSANGNVEHTALYRSQSRPQSAEAHRVTSNEQRAKMLKVFGENASVLQEEGISAADAKQAGFSADELFEAGYLAEDLAGAGFASLPPAGSMISSRPKHRQTAASEVTVQSEGAEHAGASSTDGSESSSTDGSKAAETAPPRRLKS